MHCKNRTSFIRYETWLFFFANISIGDLNLVVQQALSKITIFINSFFCFFAVN